MELTKEQKKIIEETMTNEDGEFQVQACAGSGSLSDSWVWYNF